MEPFPFKPDPPRCPSSETKKQTGAAAIRRPAKFVQGQFVESDYESDLEGSRIPPRWAPPGSDTETDSYKKVHLPKLSTDKPTAAQFPKDKTPSPPSKFDANPPQFDGPPRPEFAKQPEMYRKSSITGTETVQRVQMEESTRFSKRFVTMEQTTRTVQLFPAQQVVPEVVRPAEQQRLEPFPFVPDPPQPKKVHSPATIGRPSKFIPAGGARESDYESDYDGVKFRPRWTPAGSDAEYEPAYRKVQPPASSGGCKRPSGARTPTPPTVFDNPPSFQGPPRPVISPSDVIKIKSALDMTEERPVLVKPKAIRPSPPAPLKAIQPSVKAFNQLADPPPSAAVARNYYEIV